MNVLKKIRDWFLSPFWKVDAEFEYGIDQFDEQILKNQVTIMETLKFMPKSPVFKPIERDISNFLNKRIDESNRLILGVDN